MSAKPHPLRRLVRYAREQRREIGLASLFSVLNKIFDLAPPVLIGAAVDIVVSREDSWLASLGVGDAATQLLVLGVVTVVVWGFESLFEYVHAVYWRNLAQSTEHALRVDAYAHVQTLEMAYFEDRSTGGLMAILNDDINQLERFLDTGANDLVQVLTTVVVIGGIFFALAPSVAWWAILPMPFVIWGSLAFQKRIAPRYADVRHRVGALSSRLANNLGGIATIKSFTAEAHEVRQIRQDSDAYRISNRAAIRLSSAFSPLIRILIVAGFTVTLVYGGFLALDGHLNVGVYSVLVFMTQRLLWPLTRLGTTLDLYQRAMASTTRVLDLVDTPPQIVGGPVLLPTDRVEGAITFDDVSFTYANGQSVLRDLSLEIEPGQTAAIVGPTGAGKSTVIKLLLRYYDVTGGRVCLDGHDVRTLQLEDLRRATGLVSQDVFLFHGTVRENIGYGRFGADDAAIEAAARAAEAHSFILELPDGYDTVVGERGQKLSGGQRQRLSIARAVLKGPPVFILDEATSAVDNETEAAIQRSMARIAVGRTTIIIAHRLSTVRHADVIFVLDQGQLVEQGRHDELLARDGLYASLWRVQTGDTAGNGVARGPAGVKLREPGG